MLVADLEAGIGTLTRLGEGVLDAVLVVVEPTPKSLEVGRRAVALAAERDLGQVIVVANRVRDSDDADLVAAQFAGYETVLVPDDPAVEAADRGGVAVLDVAPEAPAVQALAQLGDRMAEAARPA